MQKKHIKIDVLEGVIFDVDGVLVDTERYQWLGWIEALKDFGKSVSKEEYLKYAGKSGHVIEPELLKDLHLSLKKNTLLAKKEAKLIEWFHKKKLKRMLYAKQAIQFFYKKNIPLAAASGSPKNEATLKLEKTGLLSFFQKVVGGSEVERGKPFPDIYLHATELLKVNPKHCLAFEDTQYGVESAKSAGLTCFAIPNEFSAQQDFSQADMVFENLRDAITFVTKAIN